MPEIDQPAQHHTLRLVERASRRTVPRDAGTLFRMDDGRILTVVRSAERSGLFQVKRNVLFHIRASLPEQTLPEEETAIYEYKEFQFGTGSDSIAISREGIGIYDSGTFAVNGLPSLITKQQETYRNATEADAQEMLDVATSITRTRRLDFYGRKETQRKEDALYAKHFRRQANRLIGLAESQGKAKRMTMEDDDDLRILRIGIGLAESQGKAKHMTMGDDDLVIRIRAAYYSDPEYLYSITYLNDRLVISECFFEGMHTDPQDNNNTVFPTLDYQLDADTKQFHQAGKSFWTVYPDGTCILTNKDTFKPNDEGLWVRGHTNINAANIKKDLLSRLVGLQGSNLIAAEDMGSILRQKR